jgi:hypothetical protein
VLKRRGKTIARVAAARRLLALVYYGLRDGEVRCLRKEAAWERFGRSQDASTTIDVAL